MVIELQKISVQNFLSFGKKTTEFNFSKGIDLVIGKNGYGKSSIFLDALTYVLYGSPFRKIKLASLINKINKGNLLVTLNFKINDNQYKIIRGIKPNIFEIYKNEELIEPEAETKDYQSMLEEFILKTPENIFRQIIVLGSNISSSKSFMDLSSKEKEDVFQKITDTKIFSLMGIIIDTKIKKLKTQIQELKYRDNILELNINSLKSSLESIEKQNEYYFQKRKSTKEDLISKIEQLEEDNKRYLNSLIKLKEAKTKLDLRTAELDTKNQEISDIQEVIDILNKKISNIEISLASSFVCEHCGGNNFLKKADDIDKLDEFKDKHLVFSTNKISLQDERKELESKILSLKEILLQAKPIKSKIDYNKQQIDSLNFELDELEAYIPKEMNNESLEKMEKELSEVKSELNIILNGKDNLDYINSSISSENIKGTIISQELPFLNKYINEYLEKFSLIGYNLVIDKNFKDRIISRNEENEYNQMSNGQKSRINFSIMFALLKMLEQRNGISFNTLILDEVLDSSLDSLGRDELLSILYNDFSENKNVIIISHNAEVKERLELFSRIAEIEFNGFSQLKVSQI